MEPASAWKALAMYVSATATHFRKSNQKLIIWQRYERKGSRFLTEIRAGLATFFAMAYIISVCIPAVKLLLAAPPT